MKYFTHWATAFITLFIMTYIGLQDPWVKEVLRLKSFDYLLTNEEKSPSKDITIITITPVCADLKFTIKSANLSLGQGH